MANTEKDDINIINTITLLTAENLLKNYALNLDINLLRLQLEDKNSLCRHLLRQPASHSLNLLLLNQAMERLDYEIKQINVLIDREIRLSANPEENIAGKASMELHELKNQLTTLNEKLNTLIQEHKKQTFEINQLVKQQLADWQATQAQTAHNLCEKLKKQGLSISDSFENRLRKRLNNMASDCPLPNELIENILPTPSDLSNPIIRALSYTLLEESQDARYQ